MPLPVKIFTAQELGAYFRGAVDFFNAAAIAKYKEFLPHSDGIKPISIIDKQRPNEPDIVKEFRLSIWEPITKPSFSRVVNSLSKIRRSSDWTIIYPKDEFSKIRAGFNLQEYCESNFPFFTSVTNWIFGVFLKQYLIDSNGVVLVLPLFISINETDFLEPFPQIYNSCEVVLFREQEAAILKIKSGSTYTEKKHTYTGDSFYVVNSMRIERWDQIDEKRNFRMTDFYDHNLGFLPAFKNGGVICDSEQNNFLYESRINGMLPNLNEAVAEYTDLQAAKRLNIYPERWEYTQHECPKCKGAGMLPNPNWKPDDSLDSRQIRCTSCQNGYIPSGPYSKILLRPAELGQQTLPTPPAGYIEKDIDIVRLMSESVDAHIYKALAAINFQFLEQTPLNQSGTAKEVDKEELNNTVHAIAEDLISMMDKLYRTFAYYRYKTLYPSDEIEKMLPIIPVPEHYDIISSQYMQDEIKRARDGKINNLLVNQMEIEFASKRFAQDDIINKIMRLTAVLDPLPGSTIDEKLVMNSSKTITRENNIISDNIVAFIRRALIENPDFDSWDVNKQQELMQEYAKQQMDAMSEAAKLIAQALQGGTDTEDTTEEPVTQDTNTQ